MPKENINITHYDPHLKELARKLRKNSTLSEVLLWQKIKNRQLKGYQFLRQKPIGPYIVVFFCRDLMLAIEIDGETHNFKVDSDKVRRIIWSQWESKLYGFWILT